MARAAARGDVPSCNRPIIHAALDTLREADGLVAVLVNPRTHPAARSLPDCHRAVDSSAATRPARHATLGGLVSPYSRDMQHGSAAISDGGLVRRTLAGDPEGLAPSIDDPGL